MPKEQGLKHKVGIRHAYLTRREQEQHGIAETAFFGAGIVKQMEFALAVRLQLSPSLFALYVDR